MNKYTKQVNTLDLHSVLMENETILWQGKPKKNAYILNQSAVLFPFALLWLIVDGTLITAFMMTDFFTNPLMYGFFAIHLAPVYVWLFNVLSANTKWKNSEYIITDKRILLKNGFIGYGYDSVYYTEIKSVRLNVGIIDRLLRVGDVIFTADTSYTLFDIEDFLEVYEKMQKTVLDIQSDIHYPNNLRPKENDGYNTNYKG